LSKDIPDVAAFARTTHLQRRFDQRVISQKGQEPNRIEEVRLANTVWSRQAGKRAEIDREVDQILESVHLKTRQHF
jgi:hypothetical protein